MNALQLPPTFVKQLAPGIDALSGDIDNSILDSLDLPTPYPLQSEILQSPAPRKVIASGRQVGKTVMASMSAIGGEQYGGRGLFDGAHVHLSSTSQDQSDMFWDYITIWLGNLIGTHGFYKNEGRRIIKYNGGRIKVKTGRNPDALRGGNVDKLILDECAYLSPRAWQQVGIPMLVARDGVAEFYSTPKRRNWFFELYARANDPHNEHWRAWNFNTLENPYLSQTALDMLIADMTEDDYQQEVMAKFLEGQGAVFRYIDKVAIGQVCEPYEGEFVFGVDWAMVKDYTVITVLDRNTRNMVEYDRFNGVDWNLQRGRLMTLYDKWKPITIIAEHNSIGGPNIEELQRQGLPVESFMTTGTSKPPLIESLVLAFDRGEITVLDDPVLKGELMAYERKVSATGRSQYSAPDGMHDDTVISLALAWHGVSTRPMRYAFV